MGDWVTQMDNAPGILPITLTAQEYSELVEFLLGQPTRVGMPLVQFLGKKQAEAQGASAKAPEPESTGAPAGKIVRKGTL